MSPTSFARKAIRASIERTVDLLAHAERPLLVGGDGMFWSVAAG